MRTDPDRTAFERSRDYPFRLCESRLFSRKDSNRLAFRWRRARASCVLSHVSSLRSTAARDKLIMEKYTFALRRRQSEWDRVLPRLCSFFFPLTHHFDSSMCVHRLHLDSIKVTSSLSLSSLVREQTCTSRWLLIARNNQLKLIRSLSSVHERMNRSLSF